MLLSFTRAAIALTVVVTLAIEAFPQSTSTAEADAMQDPRPANCQVTLPADGRFTPPLGDADGVFQFSFGSEKLWTVLPTDGIWRSWHSPETGDFVYSNKLRWGRQESWSAHEGPLTLTGRRVDGPSPSFTETEHFGPTGKAGVEGVVGGIAIPTFGCWEITGRYKDDELTFTVWVTPGPESTLPMLAFPARKAGRVTVAGEDEAKNLAYWVAPEIPPPAKSANVSGTVVLNAIIGGNDGMPRELQYVSGPPILMKAAMDAVKWWRYEVEQEADIETTIDVVFPLADN
jgi:hypothetical protein